VDVYIDRCIFTHTDTLIIHEYSHMYIYILFTHTSVQITALLQCGPSEDYRKWCAYFLTKKNLLLRTGFFIV